MGAKNVQEPIEQTVESEILDALSEFTDALEKGEVRKRMNCRQFRLNLHRTSYSPMLVKKTRGLLGISQPLFARFLGCSPKTIKAWEQGTNEPTPMACRFMDEIQRNPSYWREVLESVTENKTVNA
jgi:putative transcriptional regulator